MKYNDAEKLMAKAEEAFAGLDVLVISRSEGPTMIGQVEEGEELPETKPAESKRTYAVALDFVGPVASQQIEILAGLGDYAILPQEGSITRFQFN